MPRAGGRAGAPGPPSSQPRTTLIPLCTFLPVPCFQVNKQECELHQPSSSGSLAVLGGEHTRSPLPAGPRGAARDAARGDMGGRGRALQKGRSGSSFLLRAGRTAVPGTLTQADTTDTGAPHQTSLSLGHGSWWPRAGYSERTEAKQIQGVSEGDTPLWATNPRPDRRTEPDDWASVSKDPGPPGCNLQRETVGLLHMPL